MPERRVRLGGSRRGTTEDRIAVPSPGRPTLSTGPPPADPRYLTGPPPADPRYRPELPMVFSPMLASPVGRLRVIDRTSPLADPRYRPDLSPADPRYRPETSPGRSTLSTGPPPADPRYRPDLPPQIHVIDRTSPGRSTLSTGPPPADPRYRPDLPRQTRVIDRTSPGRPALSTGPPPADPRYRPDLSPGRPALSTGPPPADPRYRPDLPRQTRVIDRCQETPTFTHLGDTYFYAPGVLLGGGHLLLRTGSAAWGGWPCSEGVELDAGGVSVGGWRRVGSGATGTTPAPDRNERSWEEGRAPA